MRIHGTIQALTDRLNEIDRGDSYPTTSSFETWLDRFVVAQGEKFWKWVE